MIKYHGRSYAIGDIRNFYVVAPVQRTEVESIYECEVKVDCCMNAVFLTGRYM